MTTDDIIDKTEKINTADRIDQAGTTTSRLVDLMRSAGSVARVSSQRDDTTRYLCAAAHLDPTFADSAIREFLTEPLRAIPPSPAIDATTVLREAVAARRRRLLRDWCLLASLILFAISGVGLAIAWLVVGILLALFTATRGVLRAKLMTVIGAVVGLVLLFVVLSSVFPNLFGGSPFGGSTFGGSTFGTEGPAASLPLPSFALNGFSVVSALLALAVLVLDRYALSFLLTRSFRRGNFVANPTVDTWPGERWVRTFGSADYERELARVARAATDGNLVAYRGFEPFVGAGVRGEPVAMPIPLDPALPDEDDEDGDGDALPPEPFTLRELYEHVAQRLTELRDAASLAPSDRFAGLTDHAQVIVPIAELLVNFADPATRIVLPSLDKPPRQTIPPDVLDELAEHPVEWMRYYRCFQVETWNRDITVSVFLHFGANERMLYLEWIPFVLYPIANQYRIVDQLPVEPLGPLRDALIEWVRMPGTLLMRLGGLFKPIRPIKSRPGLVQPAKYGTSDSLRELAMRRGSNNYFQDADVTRYLQLLTGRLIRAIGEFLEERGIEVTEFMAAAKPVGDHYTFNGPVNAEMIGNNNRMNARPQTRPQPRRKD